MAQNGFFFVVVRQLIAETISPLLKVFKNRVFLLQPECSINHQVGKSWVSDLARNLSQVGSPGQL